VKIFLWPAHQFIGIDVPAARGCLIERLHGLVHVTVAVIHLLRREYHVTDITRPSLTGLAATVALVCGAQAQQLTTRPANKILGPRSRHESGRVAPRPNEPRLSSGAMYTFWRERCG